MRLQCRVYVLSIDLKRKSYLVNQPYDSFKTVVSEYNLRRWIIVSDKNVPLKLVLIETHFDYLLTIFGYSRLLWVRGTTSQLT